MLVFIKGNSITLRSLSESDAEGNYSNWLNDEEVCIYNSHHRYPYSVAELKEYIISVNSNKANLVLAILEKDNMQHIGNIALQNINYIDRNAEIAYLIGEKEYWGKGVAREATELMLKHAFCSLNLERVYCGTSENNSRMRGLANRMNFTEEGIRRNAIYNNGRYEDIIEYGILREEYLKNNHVADSKQV